jgi:hypothetical protein
MNVFGPPDEDWLASIGRVLEIRDRVLMSRSLSRTSGTAATRKSFGRRSGAMLSANVAIDILGVVNLWHGKIAFRALPWARIVARPEYRNVTVLGGVP